MGQGLTIATWNVNSIKARLPNVEAWLREAQPDIVLLQEIKCVTDAFPYEAIEALGYNVAAHGQKTYNGVAILSKMPLEDVQTGLPGGDTDEQARYIEAVVSTNNSVVRVASIYVPNGTHAPGEDDVHEKFAYKLAFLDRLQAHAETLLTYDEKFVLGGDYNVAPKPLDVYDADRLIGTVCYHPMEHQHYRPLVNAGLVDAYRALHPAEPGFSWWDYRAGRWERNEGLRIDHLLLSPQASDALVACDVDRGPRSQAKASDHTPVWCTLSV